MVALAQPETASIVASLLRTQMGLKEDQVFIENQEHNLPNDSRLYLSVEILGDHVFAGNATQSADVDDNLVETTTTNTMEMVQISLFSRSIEARTRRLEATASFASQLAQQLAEKYNLSFARIPSAFVNASVTEGPARLNKYVATINVLRGYSFQKPVEYYDNFRPERLVIEQ